MMDCIISQTKQPVNDSIKAFGDSNTPNIAPLLTFATRFSIQTCCH